MAAAPASPSDALRERGNAEFRAGAFLKAAASYTKALQADPSNPVLYSNRSLALLKLNKLSKALADAQHCVKLDPANIKGWYRQAQVLETQGDVEQAILVLQAGAEAAAGSHDAEVAQQIKMLSRKLRDQGRAGAGTSSSNSGSGRMHNCVTGAGVIRENGGKAPTSPAEADALAFADDWLQYAVEQMQAHGTDFAPSVHFLPGTGNNSPLAPHEAGSISGLHAFEDPAALSDFVGFVRAKGEEMGTRAAVSIVPKAKVAFPQMWLHHLWPFAKDQDGVFVQLQAVVPPSVGGEKAADGLHSKANKGRSTAAPGRGRGKPSDAGAGSDQAGGTTAAAPAPALGKLWFVRLGERTDGGWRARAPAEMPYDLSLLPSILRL